MKRRGKKNVCVHGCQNRFCIFSFRSARDTLNESEANCDEQTNKNERNKQHTHNWASDRFEIRMHAHDIYLITN